MVSQFTGRQDSPVDPCDMISRNFGGTDCLPSILDTDNSLYQVDVRLSRHKAAWINPLCAQQQPLHDSSASRKHCVGDAPSSVQLSSLTAGESLTERVLSENTADSSSTSAHGSGEESNDFSLTREKHVALWRGSQHASLLKNSKTVAISLCPKVSSDCFESSRWTASADEGAVQSSRGSHSGNFFSPETFVLPGDVEEENLHFYAADMIISVMEKMKCNVLSQQQQENWGPEEASGSQGSEQTNAEATLYSHAKQELGSSTSSDSGCEGCAALQASPGAEVPSHSPVVTEACDSDLDEFVILELEEFKDITETCRRSCTSKSVTYESDCSSAERLARELFQGFQKCWVLSEPNYLLPGSPTAAGSIDVSEEHMGEDSDSRGGVTQETTLKPRIPGTEDWVPPRFQIILEVHPPLKRDMAVVAQNFFCAGCGVPIEPKLVKRLRYCEYLGKYFCECCHSYAESCIPARILMAWDFRKYHVSNFSKWLLNSIWHQPIFNLLNLSHSLYAKAKELDRVKDMQEQLFHIKKLLKTCRFASRALKAFEQVPSHLTDARHLFSLDDLLRTKKGLLGPLLKDILKASLAHVASCELCQGKGFICEFCRSTAVIFPFQTVTCRRCSACSACFHRQCFQSTRCPRCVRITARRTLLESLPSAQT